jgi:tetratricopeptide (TPR) repeat protein
MNKKVDVNYIKSEFAKVNNYFINKNFKKVIEKTLSLLKKDPYQIVFYNYTGLSYRQLGQYQNAEIIFKKGLKIFPRSLTILTNLGSLYREMLRYDDAEEYLNKALKINENDHACLCNMANLQRDLNKHELSIKLYEKAYKINNNNETLLFNLAGAYQIMNEFEKSKKILKEIHIKFPKNIKADYMFSTIHDYGEIDNQRNLMIKKFESQITTQEKVYLGFAIAKSYSDIKMYEKSSKYFVNANKLQHSLMKDYNFENDIKIFDIIKNRFENFQFNLDVTKKTPDKIFIVGLPRSGTTLAHQIISSHSKVHGAGELPIINMIFRNKILDNEFLDIFFVNQNLKNNPALKGVVNDIEMFFNKFGSNIILDKAPLNFLWIGFIKALFPNSKIIHCKRNLRDTALSIYKNCFDGQSIPWSYNDKNLVKFIRAYKDLMVFWGNKLSGHIYNLEYENLITNQSTETKKIINFCNIEWDPNCLNFTKNKTPIKTVSISQARKPIYNTSNNLSDKYLEYLDFLKSL